MTTPRHGHPPEPHHSFKLVFHCEIVGGSAKTSNETSDVGFFGPDEIPPLSLGRVSPSQIAKFFGVFRKTLTGQRILIDAAQPQNADSETRFLL